MSFSAAPGSQVGFWQRALDLMDEVGARMHLEGRQGEAGVDDVDYAIEKG